MEKLTKKQVNGMLKILKQGKKNREALGDVYIQEYNGKNYATFTDSYSAVMIPTELEKTGAIPFNEIEVWYKLARAKDMLDFNEFEEKIKDVEPVYDIVRFFKEDSEREAVETIAINSSILQTIQTILGTGHVSIEFTGQYKPLYVSNTENDIIAIMLPMRLNR